MRLTTDLVTGRGDSAVYTFGSFRTARTSRHFGVDATAQRQQASDYDQAFLLQLMPYAA
jgi:hypothetical protein